MKDKSSYTVMIVDDNLENLRVAAGIVSRAGYEVILVRNGQDVLTGVKKHDLDAILLDVMMPGMDGFEVCRELKKDPDTSDIPVIFVSAKSEVISIEKGFELGGDDYVTKPYSSRVLLARLRTHIEASENRRRLQASQTRYRELFMGMPSGFALHEVVTDNEGKVIDYRFLDINPAFEELTGMKAADIIGRLETEIQPDIEQEWIETYGKVAMDGKMIEFERYAGPLKKWFWVRAFSPVKGQFATIFQDITDKKVK
jgi:PAS domain S-box-containing protein